MYIVKLPGGNYINLALVKSVEVDKDPIVVLIHWGGNYRTVYDKEDALAIIQSMNYIAAVNIPQAEKVAQEIFNTFHPADAI